MIEIYKVDYTKYVDLIGTAHFTKRSLNDAYEAVKEYKPKDVAIELDLGRFNQLNAVCVNCPRRHSCKGICEFTGAAQAIGNVDANIWLIDMTETEIKNRINKTIKPYERFTERHPINPYSVENPAWLWERGHKEKVVENSKRQIEILRRRSPTIWRVLLDERNALMAARLAWIVTKNMDEERQPKVLAFVGAAHVNGIEELLSAPYTLKEELQRLNLSLTKPTLVRRVAVQAS